MARRLAPAVLRPTRRGERLDQVVHQHGQDLGGGARRVHHHRLPHVHRRGAHAVRRVAARHEDVRQHLQDGAGGAAHWPTPDLLPDLMVQRSMRSMYRARGAVTKLRTVQQYTSYLGAPRCGGRCRRRPGWRRPAPRWRCPRRRRRPPAPCPSPPPPAARIKLLGGWRRRTSEARAWQMHRAHTHTQHVRLGNVPPAGRKK